LLVREHIAGRLHPPLQELYAATVRRVRSEVSARQRRHHAHLHGASKAVVRNDSRLQALLCDKYSQTTFSENVVVFLHNCLGLV